MSYITQAGVNEVRDTRQPTFEEKLDAIVYKFHGRVFLDGEEPTMEYVDNFKSELKSLILSDVVGPRPTLAVFTKDIDRWEEQRSIINGSKT